MAAKAIYRHFKGGLYLLLGIARHTENNTELAIYEAVEPDPKASEDLWARPKEMFFEQVRAGSDREIPRFEFTGNIFDGWLTGFPSTSGMYQVLLSDGEQIITPWNDGSGKNTDSHGDVRPPGWSALKDWRGKVVAWRTLPKVPQWFEVKL